MDEFNPDDAGGATLARPPLGEFRLQTERVERLARRLETAGDPETRVIALDLVQSVVELHGAALQRLVNSRARTPEGGQALAEAAEDDLVSAMLLHSSIPMTSKRESCVVLKKSGRI
jgi:hypothetical protein